jgi:MFS family permease
VLWPCWLLQPLCTNVLYTLEGRVSHGVSGRSRDGLGTVLGPIIGGAFTDSLAGWRWVFYINLCIGAVCAPVYLCILPDKDPRPGVSLTDRAREIDYVGAVLTFGAFVSGTMAVSFGGITYLWNSGKIIGLFVCSGVLFIMLGI